MTDRLLTKRFQIVYVYGNLFSLLSKSEVRTHIFESTNRFQVYVYGNIFLLYPNLKLGYIFLNHPVLIYPIFSL